ncbi:hypothetical protein D9M72_537240 [compost metagenome]
MAAFAHDLRAGGGASRGGATIGGTGRVRGVEVDLAFLPVTGLRLHEDHGVRPRGGVLEQVVGLVRVRRRDHLQPGHVCKERFKAFPVVLRGADTAEAGHAQGDRHRHGAAAAVVHPGDLADDLVDGRIGEAVELDLGNGVESGHGQAHGHAQDA